MAYTFCPFREGKFLTFVGGRIIKKAFTGDGGKE